MQALTGDDDPVAVVAARAREVARNAMDKGWDGPPFDPFALAEILKIEVVANSEIPDARTVPVGKGRVRIEFNSNRPRGRLRYSIAHEIAHTLFPDSAEKIRNRAFRSELQGDEWQLEALCNVAAAELLMPAGPLVQLRLDDLTIRKVLELQRRFEVSTEALVIRLAETSDDPVAAFCASPRQREGLPQEYELDYLVPSFSWDARIPARLRLPPDSVVRQCTAIGFSAHGVESWSAAGAPAEVEAVGIPPYPGSATPRVVGLLKPADAANRATARECPEHVFGSALEPRGKGRRLIVQIVNDKTAVWGGGGFASAVRREWPIVQEDFRRWAEQDHASFKLGAVRICEVDRTTSVASIIAQHGYGPSSTPRIRYSALRTAFDIVAGVAAETRSSVHMPRIGTGFAGGQWSVIRDIVREALCRAGVTVTVYDQTGSTPQPEAQAALDLF